MAQHVRTTTSLLVCALLVPVSGCYEGLGTASNGDGAFASEAGGDSAASGAVSTSGRTPDSSGDTGEAATDAGDDGGLDATDEGGSETGDPSGEESANLASGIAITTVEMNQGVAITLVREGAVVPAGSRNAAPIRGRAALVRGLWSLSSDFVPRRIEARLLLTSSAGHARVFTHEREISGPVWASDWTWEKTRRRIESLSNTNLIPAPTVDLLAGIVHDSGDATWFSVKGEPLPVRRRSASEQVVFFRDGNAIDTRAAMTGPISDLDAHWVLVEQPAAFDRAQWRDGVSVRDIERSALDRFERMRATK